MAKQLYYVEPQPYDPERGYRVTTSSCCYNIDYDLQKMAVRTNVKPSDNSEHEIAAAVEKANEILKNSGLTNYYEYR